MIPLRDQLVSTADAFGTATKRSRARVSTLVMHQGQRLDRFAKGDLDITLRSFEKAMLWFAANWPEGEPWPEGVPRPLVSQLEPEDAA